MTTPPRTENFGRGTLLSAIVIPVGIIVWVLVWNLGFIASIVALAIAYGAFWLYKLGAGKVGIAGAIVVSLITLTTVLLAFFAGIVWDYATWTSQDLGGTTSEYAFDPTFIRYVAEDLFTYGNFEFYSTDFLISLGLAALGAGGLLFRTFREARQPEAPIEWPTTEAADGSVEDPTTEAEPQPKA